MISLITHLHMLSFWLQVYKLPIDRLYATYFGGDVKSGLAPDIEARDIWLKFLPAGHVLPFGTKVCFYLLFSNFAFILSCDFYVHQDCS